MHPPSTILPTFFPAPSLPSIEQHLTYLSNLFNPENVEINLVGDPSESGMGEEEGNDRMDEFEVQFSRQWLEKLIGLASRKSEEDGWSEVMDESAGLLATLAGHSSAGPSTRTYILPAPSNITSSSSTTIFSDATSPLAAPPISLKVRDTTLLSSSTGHRTWGSAPLLARLITVAPSSFFRPSRTPLRILELGSGTGLVGLTVAATLTRLGESADVVLSDFEEPVLENLGYNVKENVREIDGVEVEVRRLDWSSFVSTDKRMIAEEDKYDLIFGADLVYEPAHIPWLDATVSALLRKPSPTAPMPAFHLIIPIRLTHSQEYHSFDTTFGAQNHDQEAASPKDSARLVAVENWDLSGVDGFQESVNSVTTYKRYEIKWNTDTC